MSLIKYDRYKDSGIEWLGIIPEHWEVKRIKDLCEMKSGFYINANDFIDDGFPVYGGNGFRGYSAEYNHNGHYILIGRQGALCGNINYAEEKFWATEHAIVLYKKNSINTFWCGETLRIMNLNQHSLAAAQPGLSVEKIRRLKLPVPSTKEQQQIANYLDQQTNTIDKKIKLLKAKIEHYQALKKSLINETVCRGLDKTVTLKDSGIEWIGAIPEHWEIKRIKSLFHVSRGRVISQNELIKNGLYPVYSSQTENDGCLGHIDTYDYYKDTLTWTTDGANAGTVFKRTGNYNCTNICGILEPINKNANLDFLFYSVKVSTKHNKRIDTNGAKIMSNEMKIISITLPPLKEQQQITKYLDDKTSIIDQIITNIQSQVAQLKELRKSLINEVVTGKVRVPEMENVQ